VCTDIAPRTARGSVGSPCMRNSGLGVISIALDPAKRASWSPVPIRLFRAVAWPRDSSSDSDKLVAKNRISQRKQWTSEACKSAGLRLRRFESYLSHHYKRVAPLALVLWCRGSDQTVARPSDHAGDKGRIVASPRSAADGGNNGARA
jgi:hypothetical protein